MHRAIFIVTVSAKCGTTDSSRCATGDGSSATSVLVAKLGTGVPADLSTCVATRARCYTATISPFAKQSDSLAICTNKT